MLSIVLRDLRFSSAVVHQVSNFSMSLTFWFWLSSCCTFFGSDFFLRASAHYLIDEWHPFSLTVLYCLLSYSELTNAGRSSCSFREWVVHGMCCKHRCSGGISYLCWGNFFFLLVSLRCGAGIDYNHMHNLWWVLNTCHAIYLGFFPFPFERERMR